LRVPSPSTSNDTTTSSTAGSKGLRTKFSYVICSEYGHYTHHCPALPHFLQTLAIVCQTSRPEPSSLPLTSSHVTDICYVSSSFPEWMRCPCALSYSLSHFTYRCPLMVAYQGRHSTSIQPNMITSPLVKHSPYIFNVPSPKPESLPIPPRFTVRLSKDIPPNPPNSLVTFPLEILPPTQFLIQSILTFGLCQASHHTWYVISHLCPRHLRTLTL
jgi:hypothetical protein